MSIEDRLMSLLMDSDHQLTSHRYSDWPAEPPQHVSARQNPSTSSAFNSLAHPDDDWTKVVDLAERRRIQNRIAQRNYRKKIKERMADLEKRAGGDTTSPIDIAKAKSNEQTTKEKYNNSDYDRTTNAGDDANRNETIAPQRAEELNDKSEEYWFTYPVESLSISSEPASRTSLTATSSQVPRQDKVPTTGKEPIGKKIDLLPKSSTGNSAIDNMPSQPTSTIPNNVIALRLTEAVTGMEEVSGPKRVQKHPATFQCSVCPKRFTRAYNLRSHLRTHTDERPFKCTVCGEAFARHFDRRRHESFHSGEKKFVCKGGLKDGGQWGCGQRFARVDALGRHFWSQAGRMCVKPLLDEEDFELQRAKQPLSNQLTTIGFRLPAGLLAQYPALANIDLVAGESDDTGYVSGTDTGFCETDDGLQKLSFRHQRGPVDNKQGLRLDTPEVLDDKLPRASSQLLSYTPQHQASAADSGTTDARPESPNEEGLQPGLNRDQSQLHSRQSKGGDVDDAEVTFQEDTDCQHSDDNMSLRSFTGSVFDMASIVSSASSLPSNSHAMVASFVDVLLRDPSMDRLLAITTSEFGVTSGRFTRNFSRILKSYSRHLQQSIESGIQDDRDKCLIAAKSVSSARHQVSNLIASRYNERALDERDFTHREVNIISRHLDQPVLEWNDEPSSNEESGGEELDFRVGDLEQFLLSGEPFRLLKRNLRSLVIPDEFLHCVHESGREFLNLIFTDRRPRSFARGLLNALANGRDIRSDLDMQLRLMAAELKAECTNISQLDAAVFLETYSHYISAVAIDKVKDVFTPPSQATQGDMQSENKPELPHEDLLEQVVADSLPSVLYVDLEPHRTFLASSSAFASFIDILRGLVYPTFFTEATRSVKATIRSAETSEDRLLATEGQYLLAILSEMQSCLHQRKIPFNFSMKQSETHLKALNRIKLAIEASTAAEWDWWPLQPPSRPGRHDRAELSWQCSCGINRNKLILPSYASELQRIFNNFPLSISGSDGPIDRSARSLSNASSMAGASTQSTGSASTDTSGLQSASSPSSSANSAITPPDSVVDFGTGPRRYIYVFLLTKASEYTLDTIDVSSMESRDFFQALRSIYNKHRGFWRRAFSVFVYNHCDFIKIIKPEPDTFMPGELKFELPADHDDEYHYRPRPTYSAPVTKHMFRHYFYGCYDSSALSHRLHACLPLAPTCRIRSPAAELLEYLPKRDRKVAAAAQSDKVEVCYGLAARECRSFFRVVVYLCLVMTPAFWFIFAWLFAWGDRGDLQDATVPMTLTLAVLSILWAVIYSGSDVRKDYGDK